MFKYNLQPLTDVERFNIQLILKNLAKSSSEKKFLNPPNYLLQIYPRERHLLGVPALPLASSGSQVSETLPTLYVSLSSLRD